MRSDHQDGTTGHRLRRPAAALLAVAAALLPLAGPAPASASAPTRVVGADVSWPQCPKGMGIPERRGEGQPMPLRTARMVVLGITNGIAFTPNPCLTRQLAWVRNHHVYAAGYAMTTYPRPRQVRKYGADGPFRHAQLVGKLRNTGFAQARYNVATMKRTGLRSPVVWVDVEPSTVRPWSRNLARNRAVLRGVVAGYRAAGYRVGFYSTQYLWQEIVGSAGYRLPEWRPAGVTSRAAALYKCSHYSFQGGPAVLAQWGTGRRDFDVMCPGYGRRAVMRRYFHKY
jgi:hypothetical protein